MPTQFFTVGLLMLFSAMLPGPDFALVTKNTLLYSRRSGFFTSLGLGTAALVHISYCTLGLAVIISNSLLFSIIKYIGACYLIYLGVSSLLSKHSSDIVSYKKGLKKITTSRLASFRQGFLCNLLNPKATLFFLALFTVIIKPKTPTSWMISYAMEIFFIIILWFCSLTFILSHPCVTQLLRRAEKIIPKILGIFLIGFGIILAFVKK
ncbi:MAG: LysE family translocator [Rickettsiella sp.]|nr:LysE family translocator [Rickettsiella sp.]